MSKTFIERLPPQNLDAERSVLGGILLDNSAMHKVSELLRAEQFYREAHRTIFQAMFALHERGEPVDLVTLTEELQRKGALQEVGGAAYLAALADQVPTAANIGYYAKIVRDKSVLRQVIEAATEIATRGYEEVEEVDEFLDRSEQLILEISRKQRKKGFVPIHDVVYQSFKSIEEAFNRKEAVTGIPTKFGKFDLLTCGLQRSDLVIIAGRPGMGKTAFALNIARNVAVEGKIPVAIFSLEMSKEQLVTRLFSAEAGIDSMKLRTGHFPRSYWTVLTQAADVLAQAPIFIDDSPIISVLEMRSKARQMKFQENIGLIVVDYLQLMSSGGRAESRIQEISEISRSLKQLAKELDVPVVALSQLNREPEKRNDKRPVLADLRESGAIEQDADLIVFLYREECYNRDKPECKGIAEVIIGKQRNGPLGTVQLYFKPEVTRFAEIEERYDA
jgi:replicative DNA helicase